MGNKQTSKNKKNDILRIADEYKNNGNIEKAAQCFMEQVVEFNDISGYYNLGMLYTDINKPESIKYFELFLKHMKINYSEYHHDCIITTSMLCHLYAKIDSNKAIAYKNISIGSNLYSGEQCYFIGSMYYDMDDLQQSIYYYKISAKLMYFSSYYFLGQIYLVNFGNYKKALKYYNLFMAHNKIELDIEEKARILQDIDTINKELDKEKVIETDNKDKNKKLKKIYTDIDNDVCIFCRDDLMNTNNTLITLLCGHVFHSKCYTDYKKGCCICTS